MDTLDTLLLSCGTAESRGILRSVFEESFNILEADNLLQTNLLLKQNQECISVLLLDSTDPEKTDLFLRGGQPQDHASVPFIVITGDEDPDTVANAFRLGATDVIPLQYDPLAMQRRVLNIADLHMHRRHMEKLVAQQAETLRHSNDAMVDALSSIIEYRSAESGHHILRIRHFTRVLLEEVARSCPEYKLTENTVSIISSAAALHDIGKISIPDAILNKPGRLTPEEWGIMKEHVLTGCRILETLGDVGNEEYLRYAHNICHYHHERWNGGGYPEGIAGDDIPICAQVVGLADAYDALTSSRVYKEAFSFEQALSMILHGECGAFSPRLLECFKHVSGRMAQLAAAYADGLSPKSERFDPILPPPERDTQADTLNAVQKKYQSLLHYMDIAVIETDARRRLYHILYNPYPELSVLSAGKTLSEVRRTLIQRLVIPEEQMPMQQFLFRDIPEFLKSGLRRQTHHFHVRSDMPPYVVPYQVTLLRPAPNDEDSKALLFLCQRLSEETEAAHRPAADTYGERFSLPFLLCRNDRMLTAKLFTPTLAALAGYTQEELEAVLQGQLIRLFPQEEQEVFRQELTAAFTESSHAQLECALQHRDGHRVWVQLRAHLTVEENGEELIRGIMTDISHSKQRESALQAELALHRSVLSETQNILFEWDSVADTIRFSRTWKEVFGYEPLKDRLRSAITTDSHFHPNDIPAFMSSVRALESGSSPQTVDVRIAKADGRYLWCRFRSIGSYDSNRALQKITGIITNVDAEKHAAQALRDQAERDSLTRLLNKHTARRQAEAYLAAFPKGAQCAMLILDLDNFKHINDYYGHMFGDAVLSQAAKEIRRLFRPNDIVSRIGGDEFMVLMCGTSDRELVEKRCRQLTRLFRNLFPGQLPENTIGCSIGIALSPEHSSTYTELFRQADTALYRAKAQGKNGYAFFDSRNSALRFSQAPATVIKTRIDSDEEPDLASNNFAQYAFQRLYQAADIESAVQEILALIGRQTNVSRVYIFENSSDNRYCSNTFEWCNEDVSPELDHLQQVSYEADIPGYEENFDEQGIFYCPDISDLPPHLHAILAPQGVRSLLQCAIRDNGVFRGYVGFDECSQTRFWTKEQIDILRFLSDVLSTFLLKQRSQEQLRRQLEDFKNIMDSQNAWIYAIDAETNRLLFLNSRVRELVPTAHPGDICYRALTGLDQPCASCPVQETLRSGACHCALDSPRSGLTVETESSLLRWQGKEAVLLSCREVRPADTQK